MTPGDICLMPSGRVARYEGGDQFGAMFRYLEQNGQPAKHRGEPDTVCVRSMRLLTLLNAQHINGKRGVYEA
jgi:hypothetical protein